MTDQIELGERALDRQKQRSGFILAILWAVVAGVVFTVLLWTRSSGSRNTCGGIAVAVGLLALVACFRDNFLGPRRSTWAVLLLITCALIVAIVIWNRLFLHYIDSSGYTENN